MKLDETWNVSAMPEGFKDRDSLTDLVTRWPSSAEVGVTRPFEYTRGPVEKAASIREITYTREIKSEE